MTDSGVVRATEEVALEWLAAGRRVVQALLVEVEGSAPLPVGAMMLIGERGEIEGSITGGCVEGAVVAEAEAILAGERGPGLCTYGISDELAGTVGLMCGGIVQVLVAELRDGDAETERVVLASHLEGRPTAVATLIEGPRAGARIGVLGTEAIGSLGMTPLLDRNVAREAVGLLAEGKSTIRRFGADGATLGDELPVHIRAYAPPPRMFIFGAVDFSAAIAPFAARIGYDVVICDARDRFSRSGRFSADAEVRVGWPPAVLDADLGPRDAVLVFTHDPKFDEPALIAAMATEAGYIGALGSRQTTANRARRLRASGMPDAQIARLHAPCGLDIGSRTAEETAISVLAEIIATRASREPRSLRSTSGPIHGHDADVARSA